MIGGSGGVKERKFGTEPETADRLAGRDRDCCISTKDWAVGVDEGLTKEK